MKTDLTNRMAIPAETRKPAGRPQKYGTPMSKTYLPAPLNDAIKPRLHHWPEIKSFVETLPLPTAQGSTKTQTGGNTSDNQTNESNPYGR